MNQLRKRIVGELLETVKAMQKDIQDLKGDEYLDMELLDRMKTKFSRYKTDYQMSRAAHQNFVKAQAALGNLYEALTDVIKEKPLPECNRKSGA